MKSKAKQLAAISLLLFFLVSGYAKANETNIPVSSRETTEKTLLLESWMSNETIWNTSTYISFNVYPEAEIHLSIENWMMDDKLFDNSLQLENEIEKQLNLERWMTNEKVWN